LFLVSLFLRLLSPFLPFSHHLLPFFPQYSSSVFSFFFTVSFYFHRHSSSNPFLILQNFFIFIRLIFSIHLHIIGFHFTLSCIFQFSSIPLFTFQFSPFSSTWFFRDSVSLISSSLCSHLWSYDLHIYAFNAWNVWHVWKLQPFIFIGSLLATCTPHANFSFCRPGGCYDVS
jgi:hypothetical protein